MSERVVIANADEKLNEPSARKPKKIFQIASVTARADIALASAQTDFANERACGSGTRPATRLSFTPLNQSRSRSRRVTQCDAMHERI
jgi:hypothetical protein